MKVLFAFLTGCSLLSQMDYVIAQPGMTYGSTLYRLFTVAPGVSSAADSSARPTGKPRGANKELLKACCEKIVKDGQRIYYLNNRNGKMRLQVRGIYARGATIFFALRLNNRSPLDYDVDSIRFFIAEKERGKSPPSLVGEISPVFVYDSIAVVKGFGRSTGVIVLPRFTLAHRRRLLIEVMEKNGGRQLRVEATNFTLENARLI